MKSYVFNAHGNIVNARITLGSDGYSWDVSHFRISDRSKTVMPDSQVTETFEESLEKLQAYINEYRPGYSPYKNVNY